MTRIYIDVNGSYGAADDIAIVEATDEELAYLAEATDTEILRFAIEKGAFEERGWV